MRKLYLYIVLWWNNCCLKHGHKKKWQMVRFYTYVGNLVWKYGCSECLEDARKQKVEEQSHREDKRYRKQDVLENLQQEFKRTVLRKDTE